MSAKPAPVQKPAESPKPAPAQKPAELAKPLTKKDALVQSLMAKYNLKGRMGKILVEAIIDRVGEQPDIVETNLMRALLPKRIHNA